MTENAEELMESIPEQTEDLSAVLSEDTIPEEAQEITIPIKFNKETKNLTVAEAGNLAQKGMKFDMISSDYERIKNLAGISGTSVSDYITSLEKDYQENRRKSLTEECSGNEEMADYVMKLENEGMTARENGFDELRENFPEIKDISDVPEEITERAALKGTNLLDEFLRYRLKLENERKALENDYEKGMQNSIGSQKSTVSPSAVTSEFLKGLWG